MRSDLHKYLSVEMPRLPRCELLPINGVTRDPHHLSEYQPGPGVRSGLRL